MKYLLLKKKNKKFWNELLNRLPQDLRSVFFKPEYLELYENDEESIRCFVFLENEKIFLYPFLICKIPNSKKYRDIKSAYGYGGPVSNSKDIEFLKKASKNLRIELYRENVVAELVKFNPFCFNKNIINVYDGKIFNEKIIVFIDLKNNSEKEILENYSKACKKKINKVLSIKKINIKIENSKKALFEFKKIYDHSMKKLKADKSYYKDLIFYQKIFKNLKNNFLIFSLYKENKILTSQLLLFDDNTVHCHMFGSTDYAKEKSLVVFSYHKLIIWAKKKGFNKINFGGGRTSDINDTLLLFKKNFSKSYLEYFIGEKILNKMIYNKLCGIKKNIQNKLFKYRNL